MLRSVLVACAATPLLLGCPMSKQDFSALVDDARACDEGDTCVLAGQGGCVCARPVNAKRAAEVDSAAEAVACCTPLGCEDVLCSGFENLRCENGACTGDRPQ